MNATLTIWKRMEATALGRWIFSRIVCSKAPYFSSISPVFINIQAGHCTVSMRKRRAVQNHLGTVHAIAMCNMAELAGGMMTDVSIPRTHRWIPMGMTVQYLKKAKTDLVATATPISPLSDETYNVEGEFPVHVEVRDTDGQTVFTAQITMKVSRKPSGQSDSEKLTQHAVTGR